MKSLVILGSTGSIGENTLQVAASRPDQFRVIGLSAHSRVDRLMAQARQFDVRLVAVADPAQAAEARRLAGPGMRVLAGDEGVAELAAAPAADIVVCGLVGLSGLKPVLSALAARHPVALATKEVLVAAGELVMAARMRAGVHLLPVDSEHSALFQCLQSAPFAAACVRAATAPAATFAETRVRRLLLTASGGPFASRPQVDFEKVTLAEALAHPRWSMGRKVTIDSATMMNKGLEIMEAHWLFGVPVAQIDVIVHPESVVHSLVEFVDGAMLAQVSPADMRFPIQYALTWPDRVDAGLPRLDLSALARLHFHLPDEERFPCLRLARAAAAAGGTSPAVLNAANEVAVEAFLQGRIAFAGIWRMVEHVLTRHAPSVIGNLDDVLQADAWARRTARAQL
jgi:1-deoxy-D-xylulose-5-phosphate reductoisomerase